MFIFFGDVCNNCEELVARDYFGSSVAVTHLRPLPGRGVPEQDAEDYVRGKSQAGEVVPEQGGDR